jgi:tetratricopeptide (TPR) repeat protein
MGEVWSAVHLLERQGVAVKLLTTEAALDARYRIAFRNEIRNAAQLDHPNLVAVYDYGEITAHEAEASGQRFATDTPWLAMEMVEGDTLLPYCGCFDWARTRVVVGGLLRALAHVHARGVYHRDMKPANVLLTQVSDRLVVKLSDFGLAHASEATEADHFNGGTPAYMAPEQFDGMWRNYGPWTDLYGLGAMLFALITGSPPFGLSRSFDESREQHRNQTVPALTPPFPVPAGFESWLRRLLEKDPSRRYRRAADAAHDFFALGPPVGEARPGAPASRADIETLRLKTLSTMTDGPGQATEEVQFTVGSSIARPPPLPPDWRVLERRRTSRVRAGLNLLGLRTLPLVGRETHRDALWAALRRCRASGTVEVIGLHGPMGMGKSRLADWLGQRAHEAGSAILMRATHGPVLLPTDGLGGMAVRFLRCDDLSVGQLRQRIAALVGDQEEEGEALLELLAPGAGGVRFASAEERHVAVEQLLWRATEERPVVMRLDDVHHGADSLRFVRRLLDRGFARPVVVVMTATDEALAERVDAAAIWEELLGHRRARAVEVGPLPPEQRAELASTVLGLDPSLAALVEQETGGDPQFTVQLVKDWVARELLVPGAEGFGFAPGRADPPPWDAEALWGRRVERVLDGADVEQEVALETAGVLGRGVDRALWEAVCARLGRTPSSELVDDLLHAGLAHGDADTWQFAHPALLTVLMERARTRGRLAEAHRAAAEELQARVEGGDDTLVERLGRHLVGAGQHEAALEPLLAGLERAVTAGDYSQAEELLRIRQSALHEAQVPMEDRRWGENELAAYDLARRQGERERAERVLADLDRRARACGWEVIGVWTRIHRARTDRLQGHLDQVVRTLRSAIEQAVAVGEPKLVAQARAELGDVEAVRGRLRAAQHWARAALADFERLDDLRGQARCWQTLGELDREAGAYDTALELLARSRALYEQTGYRWGIASVLNSEGDIARHQGGLDDAERMYRRSVALFRAIGSASAMYPQYNLALTLLARGEAHRARPVLEEGLAHFSRVGDHIGLANAHLAMARVAAADGRWIAYEDHLEEAKSLIAATNAADEDTAWIAEVAGRAALEAGEGERARAALRLALDTWQVLGRDGAVSAVAQALHPLS